MATVTTLGAGELLDAFSKVATVLSDHAAALDRLEHGSWDPEDAPVTDDDPAGPPAPDGGPGTDIAATVAAGVQTARGAGSLTELADALLGGAEAAASSPAGRGIVAVLSGLAESVRNADVLDAHRFAIGLELAAEQLAPRDDGGHAGTLPGVVAAAADGALSALDSGAALADVVIAAADDGLTELETGPDSNPALVERGVVDPTAAGFLLVLDVLASVLTGEPLPAPPLDPLADTSIEVVQRSMRFRVSCRVEPNDGCGIESANWLESQWFELGDVERFESFAPHWEVSVLTADPGAAIEVLVDVGRPRDLRIVPLPAAA